jgi:hypothetical protein
MGNRPSFPTSALDIGRPYTRDILRYELDEDEEELTDEVEPEEARAGPDLSLEGPIADEADLNEEP